MIRFKPPTMGVEIHEVFKTSPGRVDPRTGKLVKRVEFEPIAPWELEERMRARGRGRRDDDEERFRSRRRMEEEEFREFPARPRRDYKEPFWAGLSGLGATGEFFGSAIPWVFLGIAAIIALEASGVTSLSPNKVG